MSRSAGEFEQGSPNGDAPEQVLTFAEGRVGLFIDGADLSATSKALGFEIDFKRLLSLFRRRGRLMCAIYYAVLVDEQVTCSLRPLLDWLDYNGYSTVRKQARGGGSFGRHLAVSGANVELAVDAMSRADTLDHIVIVSGNGDFKSLVAVLQAGGKRVSILSTLSTRPPMVADGLRRQADRFVDLAELEHEICRQR